MRPARQAAEIFTFGGRIPAAGGAMVALVVTASLFGALAGEVRAFAALSPAAILEGEIWRLVAWAFVETGPIDLVFAALVLWWLGRDLALGWGGRRFALVYLGLAAGAAATTVILSVLAPGVVPMAGGWLGAWPVLAGLMMAWGLLNPYRQILLYFALPVSGRAIVWITLGGTLLFVLFARSLGAYVPHLAAEGLAVLYVRGLPRLGRLRLPRRRRPGRGRFTVIHVDRDPDEKPPRWLN